MKCWPGCLAVIKANGGQEQLNDAMVVCLRLLPNPGDSLKRDGEQYSLSEKTVASLPDGRVWVVRAAAEGSKLTMIDLEGLTFHMDEAPIPELFLRPILPPPGDLTPDPVSAPLEAEHV